VTPYYEDDVVTIYHGDCRDIDAWLVADVLVMDPPYGISWNQPAYLARGRSSGQRTAQHAGIQNDGDTTARDCVLDAWGQRPAMVFGSPLHPPLGAKQVLVWKKPADAGLFGSVGIWRRDWEPIYLVGPWPAVPATRSSVLTCAAGSHREYAQGVHPHAKPVDLMMSLLKESTGVIADPFMGSGSTLRAAKNLGRKAIGIEVEERYCEIAARRLGQEVLDLGGAA
jgi:hypothetical protein